MRIVLPTAEGLAQAAGAIRSGLLALYPTETVYGIGADPFSPEALQQLYVCKRRPETSPLLLVAADMEQVLAITRGLSEAARKYAEAFWPGPLSLLLPKAECLPEKVTAGSSKVCVRVPSNETARALCEAVGHAIVSTSANVTGAPPAHSLSEISLDGIAIAVDAGVLPEIPPSTVFDPDTGTVLRPGAITEAMLARIPGS